MPLTQVLCLSQPWMTAAWKASGCRGEGRREGGSMHFNPYSSRKWNLCSVELCGQRKILEEIPKCCYKWERSKNYFSSSSVCNLWGNWHIIIQKDRNETITVSLTSLAESNFAFQSSSSWQGLGHLCCQAYPKVGIKMFGPLSAFLVNDSHVF